MAKYASNHFPKPIKEIVKEIVNEPSNLNEKAGIIMIGIKDNCPDLYEYIKNVK